MKGGKFIFALVSFIFCFSISGLSRTNMDVTSRSKSLFQISLSGSQESNKALRAAQSFWKNLEPGPHAVGFNAAYRYDYTRSYTIKSDYEGNPVPGEVARPMPIYVWYPAKTATSSQSMLFQDYVFLRAAEDEFGDLNEDRKTFARNWYRWYSGAPNISENIIAGVLTQKTKAFKDAEAQTGSFPLIVYAPGYSEGGHENTVLAEYLASHGFVVAMTPMRGMFSRTGDDYMTGIEAQTRDLSFVVTEMRNFANVNPRGFGLIGFDEGGLSAALLALQNYNVDAVVYLDGSIGYRMEEINARFPYFSGARMRTAYLEAIAGVKKLNRDPTTFKPVFYDGIRYADAYSLRFKHLGHDEFTSDHLMNYVHTGHDKGEIKAPEIDASYAAMNRYTLHFLNAYIKKEKQSLAFLKSRPEETGLPADTLEKLSKEGLRFPPTEREFVAYIRERGISRGVQLYQEIKRKDPEWSILRGEGGLNRVGYQLLGTNLVREAIEIFKLNVGAYPNSVNVYDSLGEAYMKDGNTELAIKNYEKVLSLNSHDKNALEMLKQLRDKK